MGTVMILPETVKDPISLIGRRAGICYGSDISDPEKNYKRGMDCIKSGHGRTLEFVDVHMVIDGYSARCLREYMRHVGGGLSCLQASTRYINYDDMEYIVPTKVKNSKDDQVWEEYYKAMKQISKSYGYLVDNGVPKEDAANILPLGMTSKLVDKKNLRNLADMSHVRKCNRAYWEIRNMFQNIEDELRAYSDEWNTVCDLLFKPKCEVYGYCNEAHGCGKYPNEAYFRQMLYKIKKNHLTYKNITDMIDKAGEK